VHPTHVSASVFDAAARGCGVASRSGVLRAASTPHGLRCYGPGASSARRPHQISLLGSRILLERDAAPGVAESELPLRAPVRHRLSSRPR